MVDIQDLVERALEGEEAARLRIVLVCRPVIVGQVRRVLGPSRPTEDVEDVVQEVLLRLIVKLPTLRDPAQLVSFVRTMATYTSQQFLSDVTWDRLRPVNPLDTAGVLVKLAGGAEAQHPSRVEHREHLERLMAALHELLSPREREVVRLLYLEHLTPEEAAEALGIRVNYLHLIHFNVRRIARELSRKLTAG